MKRTIIAFATLLIITVIPAWADDSTQDNIAVQRDKEIMDAYLKNNYFQRRGNWLDNTFRSFDLDNNGIGAKEIERSKIISLARIRSTYISSILRHDLNGDGVVTRDEVISATSPKRRRNSGINNLNLNASSLSGANFANSLNYNNRLLDKIMEADKNGDDKITIEELVQSNPKEYRPNASRLRGLGLIKILLKYDPNNDGFLQKNEAIALLTTAYANSSALLSRAFVLNLYGIAPTCKFPTAAPDADVISVNASRGGAISDVKFNGNPQEVRSVSLNIEAGAKPLYLIASAQIPMIWQLTGATSRVSHITMSGPRRGGLAGNISAGVTGVTADKVTFVPYRSCMKNSRGTPKEKKQGYEKIIKLITGKKPQKIFALKRQSQFNLPSGSNDIMNQALPQQTNLPLVLARSFSRYFPGGISHIDPTKIVTKGSVKRNTNMPGLAGISLMIKSGAMKAEANGDIAILQKIHFPPNMHMPKGTRFIVKKGVPAPSGYAGLACVFSEDKNTPLNKPIFCE